MIATVALTVLTSLCHLLDRNTKLPVDSINFSSAQLLKKQYHVLFLSSLFHGNHSHFIKEMTLLFPLALALETYIGSFWFLIVYFLFGIISSILCWLLDRRHFENLYPGQGIILADLIWSRGASGNVYGMAAMVPLVCGPQNIFSMSIPS